MFEDLYFVHYQLKENYGAFDVCAQKIKLKVPKCINGQAHRSCTSYLHFGYIIMKLTIVAGTMQPHNVRKHQVAIDTGV